MAGLQNGNGKLRGFYFTMLVAAGTGLVSWVVSNSTTNARQDRSILQLEKLADTVLEEAGNRFTRADAIQLREIIFDLEKRVTHVEVINEYHKHE